MIPQHMTLKTIQQLLIGFALCFSLIVSGCSSDPTKNKAPIKSEQAYYSSAQTALKAKNYFLAVEQLQNIETHYPFGKYTAQAQLDLIYAQYQSGSFDAAAAAAERFIQQNPSHPKLDYAYYMRALADYDVNRGFITRVLPTTPAQRSMKPVMDAYQSFKRLVTRFPNSEYAADGRKRMIYLRNILAEHELEVGQYYLRRGAYLAAANRAQYVLKHFPESPSVPQALALSYKGYTELEMKDLAKKHLDLLVKAYPDYAELSDKGTLNYTRQSALKQRSWLNIISFGLLGDSGQ